MEQIAPSRPTKLTWMVIGVLGVIWGAAFLAAKLALESYEPMSIAMMRIGVAAAILLVFCYATGRQLPRLSDEHGPRIWFHMTIFGIITNAVPFTLLNWGQNYVSSGFAGVTMALVPLFTLPMAHFMVVGERMTVIKTIGFVIGFIGIVVLIEPASFMSSTGSDWEPIARIACVLASLCYASGTINTRLCPPTSTLAYSAGGLMIGFILMLPLALWLNGWPEIGTMAAMSGVLYLGIFPTAFATILLVWVIRTAGPTFLTTVNYQVPIWAVIFGVVFLNETIPPSFIIALAIILFGLGISQFRKSG